MISIEEIKENVIDRLNVEHNESYNSWGDVLSWVDEKTPWEMVCEEYAKEQNKEIINIMERILKFKKYQRVDDFVSIEELEETLLKYK